MKRPHENLAKSEFEKFLAKRWPKAQQEWYDVPQASEPPDWFLTFHGNRYAVEATTVVHLIAVSPGNKLSSIAVTTALFDFISEIEEAAIKAGCLHGTYNVTLCPIPDLAKNQVVLLKKFLNYIKETQGRATAASFSLGYVSNNRIEIQKINDKADKVMGGVTLGAATWGSEDQEALDDAIAHAVSEKVRKLRGVSEPKILLLLDNHIFSFSADWVSAIQAASDTGQFACICRIRPPEETVIVCASSPEWQG